MSKIHGPKRLIVINSGVYDYADLPLDKPIHLIGSNNTGKTSLIALLQFLYLDGRKDLSFLPHSPEETRKYYFENPHSWVLFECDTPSGLQVLGVHGLGPIKNYDYEHFRFRGEYDPADFLDATRTPRAAEDIYASLGRKKLERLPDPQAIRDALTGLDGNTGLSIVPVANPREYDNFKLTFKNLLRLTQVSQQDLKTLITASEAHSFLSRGGIDLGSQKDENRMIGQQRREVEDLQKIAPRIHEVIDFVNRRAAHRTHAENIWPKLLKLIGQQIDAETAKLNKAEAERTELAAQREQTKREYQSAMERSKEIAKSLGSIKDKQEELQKLETSLRDFSHTLARQSRENLQTELSQIQQSVQSVSGLSLEQAKQMLTDANARLAASKQIADGESGRTLAFLNARLTPDELKTLFRIISPGLATLPITALTDPDIAESAIRTLLASGENEQINLPGLKVDLSLLPPVDEKLLDPKKAREAIPGLERQVKHSAGCVQAAQDLASLEARSNALTAKIEAINRNISELDRLEELREQAPEWTLKQKRLEQDNKSTDESIRELEAKQETLEARQFEIQEIRTTATNRRGLLQQQLRPLLELAERMGLSTQLQSESAHRDADALAIQFRDAAHDIKDANRHINRILEVIHVQSYGRYQTNDETTTIEKLKEALNEMEASKAQLEKMWIGLIEKLRASFRHLLDDLKVVHARVNEVNRAINDVRISNIQSLKLYLPANNPWEARLRRLVDQERSSLFSNTQDDPIERLIEDFKDRSKLDLHDLFELHFEVVDSRGVKKTFPGLSNIESTGTSMTIKILINLAILTQLLGKSHPRIPFYLDECANLDKDNLRETIRHAEDLGFIAILASPDVNDAGITLYHLIPNKATGRLSAGTLKTYITELVAS